MVIDYNLVLKTNQFVLQKIPKFKIAIKEDSKLIKILSYVLFFTPNFWRYITTVYPIVYFPKFKIANENSSTFITFHYINALCHEYIHLKDRKRMWIFFSIFYFFPQILSLFALLAIFLNCWYLLFLLFLAPLPSLRAWLEFRAFKMSIASAYWLGGEYDIEWTLNQFVHSNYYFMFPFRKYLKRKIDEFLIDLKNDNIKEEYLEIKHMLLSQ